MALFPRRLAIFLFAFYRCSVAGAIPNSKPTTPLEARSNHSSDENVQAHAQYVQLATRAKSDAPSTRFVKRMNDPPPDQHQGNTPHPPANEEQQPPQPSRPQEPWSSLEMSGREMVQAFLETHSDNQKDKDTFFRPVGGNVAQLRPGLFNRIHRNSENPSIRDVPALIWWQVARKLEMYIFYAISPKMFYTLMRDSIRMFGPELMDELWQNVIKDKEGFYLGDPNRDPQDREHQPSVYQVLNDPEENMINEEPRIIELRDQLLEKASAAIREYENKAILILRVSHTSGAKRRPLTARETASMETWIASVDLRNLMTREECELLQDALRRTRYNFYWPCYNALQTVVLQVPNVWSQDSEAFNTGLGCMNVQNYLDLALTVALKNPDIPFRPPGDAEYARRRTRRHKEKLERERVDFLTARLPGWSLPGGLYALEMLPQSRDAITTHRPKPGLLNYQGHTRPLDSENRRFSKV